MRKRLGVALILIVGLIGCGGQSNDGDNLPSAEARQVAQSMLTRTYQGFSDEACKYFSGLGRLRFEAAQGSRCAEALRDLVFAQYTYRVAEPVISPSGDQAAVKVYNDVEDSRIALLLEPERGRWRISMVGIQSDTVTRRVLRMVEDGDFDPETHPGFYRP